MRTIKLEDLVGSDHTWQDILDSWWQEKGDLATFLNGLLCFGVTPCLYQGDDDMADDYLGQPIVWDGGFEWRVDRMYYIGSDGPSGGSKNVERVIHPSDKIEFC